MASENEPFLPSKEHFSEPLTSPSESKAKRWSWKIHLLIHLALILAYTAIGVAVIWNSSYVDLKSSHGQFSTAD